MGSNHVMSAAAAAALLTCSAAGAQGSAPAARPSSVQGLLGCRTITDNAARLACFDSRAAELYQAVAKKDVVVSDRAEVQKARRSLFGLSLPSMAIFGGGSDDKAPAEEEGASKIESTITAARMTPNRRWLMVIEDGAKWVQIDTKAVPRDPKPGMKIVIRRASMGSFLANIDGQIAIRVRREN